MKIIEIRSAGLRDGTPEGGWANEIRPEDGVHTLIAVFTDEGITGWGSAFTNNELVRGALHVLLPLYAGENPLEPERVSEKLHAHTFWILGNWIRRACCSCRRGPDWGSRSTWMPWRSTPASVFDPRGMSA